jgi:dTDP-4-dehydrorhamnose 3,5-epimerase
VKEGLVAAEAAPAAFEGHLPGCRQDTQSITADGIRLLQLIDGVVVREVQSVPKLNGVLTEAFRTDWFEDGAHVDQVFQVVLEPGALSAWHAHRTATDRLFTSRGLLQVVLYDARAGSPSHGRVNDLRFAAERTALVVIPPGVWHGVRNLSGSRSMLLNIPDRAYAYESPDHWRLPPDTEHIPFRFANATAPGEV